MRTNKKAKERCAINRRMLARAFKNRNGDTNSMELRNVLATSN
jgi:hypothetical protein